MSEREIENYIALVSSMLRLNKSQREEIGSELRDHLETRVEVLRNAGHAREKAMQMALEEFGDAAGLAVQFVSVVHEQRRRWIMRFATLSIVGVFLVIVFAFAMWPKDANFGGPTKTVAQDNKDAGDPVLEAPTDEEVVKAMVKSRQKRLPKQKPAVFAQNRATTDKIERALNEPTELDFTDREFRQVIFEIQDKHKIPIYLHQSAKDAGLSEDDVVSIRMSGTRLRDALELFLDSFDCTYVVKNGFLVIADSSSSPFAVRTFNCREIITYVRPGIAELALSKSRSQPSAGGGGGGFAGGDADRRQKLVTPEQVAQDRIIQLLQKMVSPQSWAEGSMEFIGDVLVVRQRGPEIHQVGQVLDDLLNEFKGNQRKLQTVPERRKLPPPVEGGEDGLGKLRPPEEQKSVRDNSLDSLSPPNNEGPESDK